MKLAFKILFDLFFYKNFFSGLQRVSLVEQAAHVKSAFSGVRFFFSSRRRWILGTAESREPRRVLDARPPGPCMVSSPPRTQPKRAETHGRAGLALRSRHALGS